MNHNSGRDCARQHAQTACFLMWKFKQILPKHVTASKLETTMCNDYLIRAFDVVRLGASQFVRTALLQIHKGKQSYPVVFLWSTCHETRRLKLQSFLEVFFRFSQKAWDQEVFRYYKHVQARRGFAASSQWAEKGTFVHLVHVTCKANGVRFWRHGG